MPRLFISGILFFLLLGAGYGLISAAHPTPWDCSDWQAFAHDDRPTAILESLAANRGKTLYCGIDQSDTFTKAETWQAGKDRNERDDTVYYGEGGHFRGFIAAQEGWLTDGESGITGQSIAVIFEFPRPQRQGRRIKYVPVGDVNARVTSCATSFSVSPCPNGIGRVAIPSGSTPAGRMTAAMETFNREVHPRLDWPAMAREIAKTVCRGRHNTPYVRRINIVGGTDPVPTGATNSGPTDTRFQLDSTTHVYQERRWTATCVVKKKGSRRR